MNAVPALADFSNDIATVIADPDIPDQVRSLRFSALMKAHGRAIYFANQGFDLFLTEPIYKKRAELIMKATTKTEIAKILELPKPVFNGSKVVNRSPYPIDEEELLIWSATSLKAPLTPAGADRMMELFNRIFHISAADF